MKEEREEVLANATMLKETIADTSALESELELTGADRGGKGKCRNPRGLHQAAWQARSRGCGV